MPNEEWNKNINATGFLADVFLASRKSDWDELKRLLEIMPERDLEELRVASVRVAQTIDTMQLRRIDKAAAP